MTIKSSRRCRPGRLERSSLTWFSVFFVGCLVALLPVPGAAFLATAFTGSAVTMRIGRSVQLRRGTGGEMAMTDFQLENDLSDFQINSEGIAVGDQVKVKRKGILLYHLPKFKEGFDAYNLVGEVKDIKLFNKKKNAEITANLPVMVAFTDPKFIAHFQFTEITLVKRAHWEE